MAVLPRLLRLPPRRKPPHYRILPSVNPDLGGRCYQYTTFALETEAGIQAHLHCFDTAVKHYQFPRARQATVVVAHAASRGEFMTWRPRPSRGALFFLDVRGIGVSRPLGYARKDAYHFMRREYYYPSQAQMLGEPLIGRRTHDVLCALDLFAGLGFASVHLAGVGLGTLPATFAACLHPLVRRVTLRHPLLSYEELTRASYYAWPLSALVPDVLQHLDLPDCYRALATRGLRLEAPWNALMRPWPVPALKQHLRQLGLPQSLVAARRAR